MGLKFETGEDPAHWKVDFEISATVRRDSANLKRVGEATSSEGFLSASVFRVGGGAAAMMRASRESWVWAVALDWLSLVGILGLDSGLWRSWVSALICLVSVCVALASWRGRHCLVPKSEKFSVL